MPCYLKPEKLRQLADLIEAVRECTPEVTSFTVNLDAEEGGEMFVLVDSDGEVGVG